MSNDDNFGLDFSQIKGLTFDFKGLVFKILSLWYVFAICIAIGLYYSHYQNKFKQSIYQLESLITIENEQNPFFTANTSISFNWGGVSGKVSKILTEVKTRSHNELVVDSLKFYMNYLDKGEYFTKDIYNKAPFIFQPDITQPQVLNQLISVTVLNSKQFELEVTFSGSSVMAQTYGDKTVGRLAVNKGAFKKIFRFNEVVRLPFLSGTFTLRNPKEPKINKTVFLQFSGFDGVVNAFKNNIRIEPLGKSSSVLKLSATGTNKAKIEDLLNTTVAVLSRTELERKNLYATKTITFIDSSLQAVGANLNKFTTDLNTFRQTNKVFDIDAEMLEINQRIKTYESSIEADDLKLTYLNSLEGYLNNKTDYSEIAAPSSVGIEEGSISSGVSSITALAIERKNLEYTTQASSPLFLDIDRKIESEKKVLLETLKTTRALIQLNSNRIRKSIAVYESKLGRLPQDQQEFLRLQRQMELSQEAYNVYLAKRSEAAIVKAANVSDIVVIDSAKDVGGGRIGPNMSLNYMAAVIGGGALPMLIIVILFLLDTHIRDAEQVERLSKIPVLGVIGKNKFNSNLVLIDHKKSVIAESFRAIRSSLQFIYKRKLQETGGKTLMVTSSVSGEGKTFTAMNMATAYAISGKKTILLGLDLRKPKIFEDFKLTNDKGVVNYLVGDASKEEVINSTHVQGLDIILSGPVPPNPAELLMSDAMADLIKELRTTYDVIILDTPPLGLVSDAMELTHHADATLYMVRLNYSKRGMLSIINNKFAKGEVKNIHYVLNFYKHKKKDQYGYGYGYSYGYGYGYGAYGNGYHDDEKTNLPKKLVKLFLKKRN